MMKTEQLLEHLEFHEDNAYAQPLLVDLQGRIIRFMLKAGQSITEHNVPHSPFYVVVLQGWGLFAGADGKEQKCGPNTLLVFDPAENHSVRALDEDLVFIGILHGIPSTRPGKEGGELGREQEH
jgi:quercetin dioxygenase-like cupin family protein